MKNGQQQISGQDWQITYKTVCGDVRGMFIIPIATGCMKNGKKVLICRDSFGGQVMALRFSGIDNPKKVSKRVVTIDREQYGRFTGTLANIQSWGVPKEWEPLPTYKIINQDIATRVVNTRHLITSFFLVFSCL